jgi:cytochrome P450
MLLACDLRFGEENKMANEPEDDFEDEPEEDLDDNELSDEEAEERYLAILQSATDITAAAVSNAGAQALENPDQVAALFTKVFDAIVNL